MLALVPACVTQHCLHTSHAECELKPEWEQKALYFIVCLGKSVGWSQQIMPNYAIIYSSQFF